MVTEERDQSPTTPWNHIPLSPDSPNRPPLAGGNGWLALVESASSCTPSQEKTFLWGGGGRKRPFPTSPSSPRAANLVHLIG